MPCHSYRKRIEVAGTTAIQDGEVIGIGNPYEQTKFILQTIEKALNELGAERSNHG